MDGEKEAEFMRLFVAHEPELRAFLRTLLPTWEAVDDVLQEASVVMWKKLDQLEDEGGFLPWAKVIVRFKALQARRTVARDRLVLSEETVTARNFLFRPGFSSLFWTGVGGGAGPQDNDRVGPLPRPGNNSDRVGVARSTRNCPSIRCPASRRRSGVNRGAGAGEGATGVSWRRGTGALRRARGAA
ncbi:MAG: hypothetical protein HKN82_03950 [Akkermansiaceae bacterium]|nr:hypothetical protein [Akkermansiaceae bacterium]NNM29651.1 hypothetical protein [Akkermansiaceae bacterium]